MLRSDKVENSLQPPLVRVNVTNLFCIANSNPPLGDFVSNLTPARPIIIHSAVYHHSFAIIICTKVQSTPFVSFIIMTPSSPTITITASARRSDIQKGKGLISCPKIIRRHLPLNNTSRRLSLGGGVWWNRKCAITTSHPITKDFYSWGASFWCSDHNTIKAFNQMHLHFHLWQSANTRSQIIISSSSIRTSCCCCCK